jgi:hypothetical protein
MSWFDKDSPLTKIVEGQHQGLSNGGRNALDVMSDANALFTVSYPSAMFYGVEQDTHEPLVLEGSNAGMPLYKFVVRNDTNDVLGMHSGTFPESGSYEFIGKMAEKMFPKSTTSCTVFGQGERLALTQDIGDPVDLGDGDVIRPQLIWTSSFNGQWATKVHDLVGRLWCMNQLISAAALFSTKHTKFHDITFAQRSGIIGEAVDRARILATQAQIMKDQVFTDQQFMELTQWLVPLPPKVEGEEWHTRTVNLIERKRGAMTAKWLEECEQWSANNRWLAYNAVQGAEQHIINSQFNTTEVGKQRSLIRAIDGRAPLATKALSFLI